MLQKFFAVFAFFTICNVACELAVEKILTPCIAKDGDCQRMLWHKVTEHLTKGDKELGILPLDPMVLQNLTVEIPGLVELTMIDGAMKGVRSCNYNKVKINLHKSRVNATIDLQCDISIAGHYKVSAQSSIIPGLVGEELLRADGNGKIEMTKLGMKLYLDFDIFKNEAGIITLVLKKGPVKYKKRFGGKVAFEAENIYLAGQNISDFVLTFLNGNWKLAMDTFGGPFFDRGVIIITEILRKFFKSVPAKVFFSDSLEEYLS